VIASHSYARIISVHGTKVSVWELIMKSEFEEHPEIDSTLQKYLESDKYRYRTKTLPNGLTKHLFMERKYGEFWLKETLHNDEMESLDPEEVATFLVHKLLLERARVLSVIALFVTAFLVTAFSTISLGVDIIEEFQILFDGATIFIFCVVAFALMWTADRRVDNRVYAACPNLISVLQKMKGFREDPYQKWWIERRIRRLQDNDRSS
jgi:hypothetical protein